MYPDGRRKLDLDQRREPDDEHSQEQDRKNRWAVAGILSRQVEPADLALLAHTEEADEQLAFAASRTSATKRGA